MLWVSNKAADYLNEIRRIADEAATPRGAEQDSLPPSEPGSKEDRLRTRSTPPVRKIAEEHGVDIAAVGSGNPGASNVTRALGWRKGIWVYVLDALKGVIATAVPLVVDGRPLAYVCGAAAIIGHMFPVFRRFRGGKGVATGSGVLLIVQPILAPLALGLWWLVTKVTGKAALGSVIAVALCVPRAKVIVLPERSPMVRIFSRSTMRRLRTDRSSSVTGRRCGRPFFQ